MPRGTDIRIGPWPGGLNRRETADKIQPNQLAECINFDIDNAGLLIPRRGYRKVVDAELFIPVGVLVGQLRALSSLIITPLTTPFEYVVFGRWDADTDITSFIFRNDPETNNGFLGVTRGGRYTSVVQYQDKFWYVPEPSSTGVGFYTNDDGTTGATGVATMPTGDEAFILKDRMFIIRKGTSTIYFSKATDFTVWSAPDGGLIQVSPGDNEPITSVQVLNNQIVIFKRFSTWILSFNDSPTGDGVLRQVSADQGAYDAVVYENELYCVNRESVYKFVNGFFQDIGNVLNFSGSKVADDAFGISPKINVLDKILVVSNCIPYYDAGAVLRTRTFAMNLDTGAWSEWMINEALIRLRSSNNSQGALDADEYYWLGNGSAFYYFTRQRDIALHYDKDFNNVSVQPRYFFKTKEYDFDDSETWKRCYSWHLDAYYEVGSVSELGTTSVIINSSRDGNVFELYSTNDVKDLIGGGNWSSFRFRTVMFLFNRPSVSPGIAPGTTIRGIRAVIGAKAPVSS